MLPQDPKRRILILGGGEDGLAAREVLSFNEGQDVVLVDLDPKVINNICDVPLLSELNNQSLSDPRIKVLNVDTMIVLEGPQEPYDVVIIDLPDPSDTHLGKLYSKSFYSLVQRRLAPEGPTVLQATRPYRARQAF